MTNDGYTMMRPLVMDFRSDRLALNILDQYMFGPAIMVNPVVQPRVNSRNVYLPGDQPWYDFWTGDKHDAGQAVDAAAPIETLPLFVRAGSIVPMGPVVQYADEKPAAPIELRVYRGADGSFTLYDDEGDNYNYEKGARATIPISWNDAKHELTIGQRDGEFPGMSKHRRFNVVFVDHDHGAGLAEEANVDQSVDYDGTATTVEGPQ